MHLPCKQGNTLRVRNWAPMSPWLSGKCQVCGYNKCLRSLEFHHLDPLQKDFTISGNLKRIKKEKVIKELEKCILVCSNCHGEIHDGLIRVDTRED